MVQTNFSIQSNLHCNMNRPAVDRQFAIRDELFEQAGLEKNIIKKKYLFDQAATRDTKAREMWEKILTEANAMPIN